MNSIRKPFLTQFNQNIKTLNGLTRNDSQVFRQFRNEVTHNDNSKKESQNQPELRRIIFFFHIFGIVFFYSILNFKSILHTHL